MNIFRSPFGRSHDQQVSYVRPMKAPPKRATTSTGTTSTPSTSSSTSSTSSTRAAPVIFPPVDGGSATWAYHERLNCWEDHGAVSLPDSNPLLGTYTVEECRKQCEMNLDCEAAIIATHVSTPEFPCFLRTRVEISQCRDYADFDVWEIQRTPSTTSLSSSTTSSSGSGTSLSLLQFGSCIFTFWCSHCLYGSFLDRFSQETLSPWMEVLTERAEELHLETTIRATM